MKKVMHDFATEVFLEDTEAKDICRLGQGEKCCAFLVAGGKGFECIRMNYPTNATIFDRLDAGTMNAKGRGGWEKCAWEQEIKETPHA